jgi:hypothetical protein
MCYPKFLIGEEMKMFGEIMLDDEDYALVSRHKICKFQGLLYIESCRKDISYRFPLSKVIYGMVSTGKTIGYKDGNKYNLQKENLVEVPHSLYYNNKGEFKGIHFYSTKKIWQLYLKKKFILFFIFKI